MLFRYPGGKSKITKKICPEIIARYNKCNVFVEPFFGSGAVTLELLKQGIVKEIWINDLDGGIAAIWNTIIYKPNELIDKINAYTPNVKDFYEFKRNLLNPNYITSTEEIDVALQKIAVHQMSFSGLGTMAGSPIGGKNQLDKNGNPKKYQIDCRWSPKTLSKNIHNIHKLFDDCRIVHGRCTSDHYLAVLRNCDEDCFVYLDPPYYEMGQQLYQCSFSLEDHMRLMHSLKGKENWLLSYDNHVYIKYLYNWAKVEEIPIKYTVTNNTDTCKELLIYPR